MTQTYPIRCRIRAEGGVTRVDIYDDIGEGGWFSDALSAKDFAAQLAGVKGPLDVHINSYGGDVDGGIAIGSNIRSYQGPKRTVVDGFACSIASVILQAGDERIAQPGSMVMIHDALSRCEGNAADMAKASAALDKHSDNIAGIYADRAGGTAQSWRDTMRAETWYTAEEAVAAGLADKVGEGQAEIPVGLDLAAFTALPGRIAARLRTLPVAQKPQDAARHDPMKGSHSHPHPAYGSQGGDSMHSHDHSHDGDASHAHGHGEPDSSSEGDDGSAQDHVPDRPAAAAEASCEALGHQCCKDAATARDLLRGLVRDEITAAAGQPGTHGDHERWDPDGDGDCDACPEGDTDNDYWDEDGNQLQDVPGSPMPAQDKALTAADVRAIFREEFRGAADGVDNSPWDGSKAWHNGASSDDPAAFYAGICAGKKDGDKATQAAWALPYKYHPGDAPNAAGVKAALGRLPQTQGLTNEAEAKATLQAAMKKVNPDYEPEDKAGDGPQDKTDDDLSGSDLEEIRAALRGAFA